LNNVSFTGKFSPIFDLKQNDFDFFKGFFTKKGSSLLTFEEKEVQVAKSL
jgi:hypothetical protein